MKNQMSYENELKDICIKIQKSFAIKINTISAIQTNHYLKKLMKLNKKTNNEHIEQLMHIIGRTKLAYKKYCNENNYIADPYVNKKIREAYTKLSKKSMNIKTKKKNIKNNKSTMQIEYNSDRGSYQIKHIENSKIIDIKEYKVKNIKHLGAKRKKVLDRLTKINYGINIFKELGVDEDKFYKVNPDIIHIFLVEGKIDYAKMYIKEVVGGETMNLPFNIKYILNRNIKKGVFSPEENKNMKQMARADRIANDLVIFSDKKKKEITKPHFVNSHSKSDIIESITRNRKIQKIKEEKEKKQKSERLEAIERGNKIQNIMEKRKLQFNNRLNRNNVTGITSDYGCKIYNIDRRNNNTRINEESQSNCRIYNIDKRHINENCKNNNTRKIAIHNER